MKTRPREDQILRELRRKGNLSLDELIADLGTSAASVRRDLAKLEARGLVRRTHGGVTLVEPLLYEPFRYDSLFQNRSSIARRRSARLGWRRPN
jgi:DeoR family transcriptional regulator of aga operon